MKEFKNIERDENGHLQDYRKWTKDIGTTMAKDDDLALTPAHWQIILLVREIYEQTETTPPMRLLIKAIKLKYDDNIGNSRYLYQLFPDGPVRLCSKYAGLPKPKHCL
jgi:tRNA 2-thiouridine synthesizing protein E